MRYERQLMMDEIGEAGQKKIAKAKVAVIGAGGLGSPVLTYLACMGVHNIRLIDHDIVAKSNLNRQFLHTEADIGSWKVDSAKEKLEALNSEIIVEGKKERVKSENAMLLLSGVDIVVDCVDNIDTRIVVGRACLALGIPLVEAGVKGFYGWVMNINRESACLECLGFQDIKAKGPSPIVGVTAGVIGCLQANECLKIILDMKETEFGVMLQYDGKNGAFDRIEIIRADTCIGHQSIENPSLI